MGMIFGLLLCAVCLFFIIVTAYDSNRFVTVSYRIRNPKIRKKVRLVLLADLHNKQYGRENERLLAAIEKICPDLVLCAGDLMTSVPGKSMEPAEKLVERLAEKYPFYYGNGNHEYRIYHDPEKFGTMGAKYRSCLRRCKVCLLENETALLPAFALKIVGLDLTGEHYRRFKDGALASEELEGMIGKYDESIYTILLAHNPVFFDSYADWGADLVLSGHVHGGVMRLPWIGGVLSTSFRLFPKYDGGMFEKGQKRMIVSRGLGSHTIPIRIFNPAELVVIDLEPERDLPG